MKIAKLILLASGILLLGCDEQSTQYSSKVKAGNEFKTTDKSNFNFTERMYLPIYSDIYFSINKEIL